MHRRRLRPIFKAVRPTRPPWVPPPDQATSSLKTRIVEDIEAHPAAGIEEMAEVLLLAEAPTVGVSRADTGAPVAAVLELLPASLKI